MIMVMFNNHIFALKMNEKGVLTVYKQKLQITKS